MWLRYNKGNKNLYLHRGTRWFTKRQKDNNMAPF